MPLYTFECEKHGKFEVKMNLDDLIRVHDKKEKIKCPKCKKVMRKIMDSPFIKVR